MAKSTCNSQVSEYCTIATLYLMFINTRDVTLLLYIKLNSMLVLEVIVISEGGIAILVFRMTLKLSDYCMENAVKKTLTYQA